MEKKDILKIIGKLAMIILLPLIPALIYEDVTMSISSVLIVTIILWGIPLSIIIAYGYITRNKITSTLSGVFFWPLFGLYLYMLKHDFTLNWWFFFDPLVIPCGLAGYLASRRGKISLSIAISLAILFIYFLTTIPD